MPVIVRPHRSTETTELLEKGLGDVQNGMFDESFVAVGDEISTDSEDGFLRGHGTRLVDGRLIASVCGVVERVNKLIYVRPLKNRYSAELGDVVVGRVSEIVGKRWRIALESRQEASLLLSAVNLPGGIQRRRTAEDELNMRDLFKEGDLVSAEVQSLHMDGSIALHTRSDKYGKLEGGQLVQVPAALVKRQKQHFHSIPALGVDIILGVNGLIWLSPHRPQQTTGPGAGSAPALTQGASSRALVEAGGVAPAVPAVPPASRAQRLTIARLAAAITSLSRLYLPIFPPTIMAAYEASVEGAVAVSAMTQPAFLETIVSAEASRRHTDQICAA